MLSFLIQFQFYIQFPLTEFAVVAIPEEFVDNEADVERGASALLLRLVIDDVVVTTPVDAGGCCCCSCWVFCVLSADDGTRIDVGT